MHGEAILFDIQKQMRLAVLNLEELATLWHFPGSTAAPLRFHVLIVLKVSLQLTCYSRFVYDTLEITTPSQTTKKYSIIDLRAPATHIVCSFRIPSTFPEQARSKLYMNMNRLCV